MPKGYEGKTKLGLEIPFPDCGNLQIDLYIGKPLGGPIEERT